jgi:hypothetical protein
MRGISSCTKFRRRESGWLGKCGTMAHGLMIETWAEGRCGQRGIRPERATD